MVLSSLSISYGSFRSVSDISTRLRRLRWPLVALCLLASGCAIGKLGYNAAPSWLGWQIDQYVSLDDDQREVVDRHLDVLHRWHRQTQLGQYAALLREVDDTLRTPVAPGEVGRVRERALALAWTPLAERLAGPMAEVLPTLRPQQLDRLRKRFAHKNRDARREYLPTSGRKTVEGARADRLTKRAEFFFGSLDSRQTELIRARAAAMPATEEALLAEREARQHRFLALVERIRQVQPDRATAEAWCRDYLASLWVVSEPARRALLEAGESAADALSAELLAQASDEQRSALSRKLRGYASDFVSWSGDRVAGR